MDATQIRTDSVSVVGLGKLGLCLATCFAESGLRAIGIDINQEIVASVNAGRSPILEPELDRAIRAVSGKTLFSYTDFAPAISDTDITYILVNTPSDENGCFSNCQIEAALSALAEELVRNGKNNHVFVVSSTVMPGSIECSFIPLIESKTGRKLNQGFMVAYCPDFVALGSVMRDFCHPDFVLIGESSPEVGKVVEKLHLRMCRNRPPVRRMPLVSAELAKISLNAYITLKISFANTVANYCEHIPGADPDLITEAIGLDKRISPYYLKGGLAFGGTCFPRDTKAFRAVAHNVGQTPFLMNAAEEVNRFQDDRLLDHVIRLHSQYHGRVAVLGLSFKPETPVIVESPGMKLIQSLLTKKIPVSVYDPIAIPAAKTVLAETGGVNFSSSAVECLAGAAVAVLAVQDEEYRQAVYALGSDQKLAVLDCWRQLDSSRIPGNISVLRWGYFHDA